MVVVEKAAEARAVSEETTTPPPNEEFKALLANLDWRYHGQSVGHRTVQSTSVDFTKFETEERS
jgi:hypothetical protein